MGFGGAQAAAVAAWAAGEAAAAAEVLAASRARAYALLDDGMFDVHRGMRIGSIQDLFERVMPPDPGTDVAVYVIEYDYSIGGVPASGFLDAATAAGAVITRARVADGKHRGVYSPVDAAAAIDTLVGREIATDAYAGNAVAVVTAGPVGAVQKQQFLSRLTAVDRDIQQLDAADKLMSLFYTSSAP